MSSRTSQVLSLVFAGLLSTSLWAQSAEKTGKSPLDELPPYITRITHFGQRADFSHDGKRILFLARTYGDVYEVDIATGVIRPKTHHYYHEGYTRALYLANGDILLSGSRTFDAANPHVSRGATAELWVLDKSGTKPPVALGEFCSEGPAVSRKNLKIAWVADHENYPDRIPEDVSLMWMAEISYDGGTPKLVHKKKILDTRDLDFECDLETQNFRPPLEKEVIFSAYGYQGGEVMGVDVETGKITHNYSQGVNSYEEPEGIFPDGQFTCVERVPSQKSAFEGNPALDIWKLSLDGKARWEQITFFSRYPTYRGTNPVVSDDGRFMAFQMARSTEPAGVGHGIFIYDFEKAAKTK